ncbi:MAG: LysR family transcriptional regulator [Bacillota bacterium]|nr:LysR family transcriptional regulator [Bacillota bacterium]
MNITQFQYLVDVGILGSFTDAANKNLMTVPTISQSIAQLEAELDVTLFSRSRKGVVPTLEGKIVLQYADGILKTIEKMKKEIALSKEDSKVSITIATIPGMISQIINTTLKFKKKFPDLNIQLIEGASNVVMNHVKSGHADIGFLSFSESRDEEALFWHPLVHGEIRLVVNTNSHLRFKDNIYGDELEDEMIVLYNEPYLIEVAKEILPEKSKNNITLTTNNIEVIFEMITKGNAVTIAPDYIINSMPAHMKNKAVSISINKYKAISYYLWRVTRKNEKLSQIIEQFTQELTNNYKDIS